MTPIGSGRWQLAILVALLAGCSQGPNEPKLVEGGGTVRYKGAPLANAVVTFIPEKGPLAMARTDFSGKFKLMTGGTSGVAVGPATATVDMPAASSGEDAPRFTKSDNPEDVKKMQESMLKKMQSTETDQSKTASLIPKRYSKQSESNLNFTVSEKASANDFQIELTE